MEASRQTLASNFFFEGLGKRGHAYKLSNFLYYVQSWRKIVTSEQFVQPKTSYAVGMLFQDDFAFIVYKTTTLTIFVENQYNYISEGKKSCKSDLTKKPTCSFV